MDRCSGRKMDWQKVQHSVEQTRWVRCSVLRLLCRSGEWLVRSSAQSSGQSLGPPEAVTQLVRAKAVAQPVRAKAVEVAEAVEKPVKGA